MGVRYGGRQKGTPNKATAKLKAFLDKVFDEAFQNDQFAKALRDDLIAMKLEPRLLVVLLAYYAGRPTVAVDHTVEGSLTLAQLIVGEVPETLDEDDDDDQDESDSTCH